MAMFEKRIEARRLRNEGWSIRDIAQKVEIAKSTSSFWCRDIALTDEQVKRLVEKDKRGLRLGAMIACENRRRERILRMKSFGDLGATKVGDIAKRDLFILGLGLYWAEGSKKYRGVRLINSDPFVIKVWIKWLNFFANVEIKDIRCCVGINESHKNRINEVQKYWSILTGIPLEQFRKPSFKKVKSKKVYLNHDEHYGTLNVITTKSTNLCYEILGAIEALGNRACA